MDENTVYIVAESRAVAEYVAERDHLRKWQWVKHERQLRARCDVEVRVIEGAGSLSRYKAIMREVARLKRDAGAPRRDLGRSLYLLAEDRRAAMTYARQHDLKHWKFLLDRKKAIGLKPQFVRVVMVPGWMNSQGARDVAKILQDHGIKLEAISEIPSQQQAQGDLL